MFFLGLQGNQYWRFDGDVMDGDYPRNISVGFDGVPDGVHAAFAVPAPSHLGREKAYFFKGTVGIVQRHSKKTNVVLKFYKTLIFKHRILSKKSISNYFCSHNMIQILSLHKFKVHKITCEMIKIHN